MRLNKNQNIVALSALIIFNSMAQADFSLDKCVKSLKENSELAKITQIIDSNGFNITRTFYNSGYHNTNSYKSILKLDFPEMTGIARYREVDYGDNLFATVPTPEYEKVMHFEFANKFRMLGNDGVYMDLGAGAAVAALQAHELNPKAQVLAVSKVQPRLADFSHIPKNSPLVQAVQKLETAVNKGSEKFKYLEMDLDQSQTPNPRSVDVMSDVVGWTSYTFHPERPLKFAYDSLRNPKDTENESAFYLALPNKRFFVYVGEGPVPVEARYLSRSELARRRDFMTFEKFMKTSVKGLEITHTGENVVDPGNEFSDAFRIVRTDDEFSCPELQIESFDEASKMRIFTIKR